MDTKRETWRVDDYIITLDRTHTNGPFVRLDRKDVNDLHFSASLLYMTGIEEGGEQRMWEVVNRRMEVFMEQYKWAFGSVPTVKDDKLGQCFAAQRWDTDEWYFDGYRMDPTP